MSEQNYNSYRAGFRKARKLTKDQLAAEIALRDKKKALQNKNKHGDGRHG